MITQLINVLFSAVITTKKKLSMKNVDLHFLVVIIQNLNKSALRYSPSLSSPLSLSLSSPPLFLFSPFSSLLIEQLDFIYGSGALYMIIFLLIY